MGWQQGLGRGLQKVGGNLNARSAAQAKALADERKAEVLYRRQINLEQLRAQNQQSNTRLGAKLRGDEAALGRGHDIALEGVRNKNLTGREEAAHRRAVELSDRKAGQARSLEQLRQSGRVGAQGSIEADAEGRQYRVTGTTAKPITIEGTEGVIDPIPPRQLTGAPAGAGRRGSAKPKEIQIVQDMVDLGIAATPKEAWDLYHRARANPAMQHKYAMEIAAMELGIETDYADEEERRALTARAQEIMSGWGRGKAIDSGGGAGGGVEGEVQDTRTVKGKTYLKINGKWYEQ